MVSISKQYRNLAGLLMVICVYQAKKKDTFKCKTSITCFFLDSAISFAGFLIVGLSAAIPKRLKNVGLVQDFNAANCNKCLCSHTKVGLVACLNGMIDLPSTHTITNTNI